MRFNGDENLLIDYVRHNAISDTQQACLTWPVNVGIEQTDPVPKLPRSHSEVSGHSRLPDAAFTGSNRHDVFDCIYALTHCSSPPKSGEYIPGWICLGILECQQ